MVTYSLEYLAMYFLNKSKLRNMSIDIFKPLFPPPPPHPVLLIPPPLTPQFSTLHHPNTNSPLFFTILFLMSYTLMSPGMFLNPDFCQNNPTVMWCTHTICLTYCPCSSPCLKNSQTHCTYAQYFCLNLGLYS